MERPSSAAAGAAHEELLRGVRRVIARNMAQSWSEIPHIHAFEHIDAEPLIEFRNRLKKTGRPAFEHLTPLTIFVAALAAALRAHPQANASIDIERDTIRFHPSIDIGVAVAAPHGLVVPVVRAADTLDLERMSLTIRELVDAARRGELAHEHMTGATATITNFGALGGEQATPLIRPTESLIMGFGSIKPRPFVVDGAVVARNTMHLVIGADHRLLDGDITTAILRHVADLLLEPLSLFLGP
jgi:pyruvate dehydrogenase E2 component (dihydrolipoamide acetyltransferase)